MCYPVFWTPFVSASSLLSKITNPAEKTKTVKFVHDCDYLSLPKNALIIKPTCWHLKGTLNEDRLSRSIDTNEELIEMMNSFYESLPLIVRKEDNEDFSFLQSCVVWWVYQQKGVEQTCKTYCLYFHNPGLT